MSHSVSHSVSHSMFIEHCSTFYEMLLFSGIRLKLLAPIGRLKNSRDPPLLACLTNHRTSDFGAGRDRRLNRESIGALAHCDALDASQKRSSPAEETRN